MLVGTLIRDDVSSVAIRGVFAIGDKIFHILERPWQNNARNKSCIPAGQYSAHFLPRSASGKYRNIYHLKPVSGRSGILIHNGNVVSHSRGCLIIGLRRGTLAGQPAVLNSRTALSELSQVTQQEPFMLNIIGQQTI
ncbi:DUF5675 family protein [Agarilytica rhodophyticola]|uniref:DUF5675 family protein n=1 Tax=Agarilytica rhodophyticola TaxID=1737490 RepID=UPI000B3429BA|nr:DUF5675 family protein [Agarilytica rhodophyticola]